MTANRAGGPAATASVRYPDAVNRSNALSASGVIGARAVTEAGAPLTTRVSAPARSFNIASAILTVGSKGMKREMTKGLALYKERLGLEFERVDGERTWEERPLTRR